jgi:hypothetical protein
MWGRQRLTRLGPEIGGASAIWVVATAGVIALAPTLADAPATPTAVAVTALFTGLGVLVGRLLPAGFGTRLGIAVVIIGQLLDVVLVLAADGRYPRTDEAGSGRVLLLLLGGYAAFLLGALAGDRSCRVGPVASDPVRESGGRSPACDRPGVAPRRSRPTSRGVVTPSAEGWLTGWARAYGCGDRGARKTT